MKTITIDDSLEHVEKFSTIGIQNGSWHFYASVGNFTVECYKGNIDDVAKAYLFETITVDDGDAYVLDLFSLVTKYVWFKFTATEGDVLLIETYGEV